MHFHDVSENFGRLIAYCISLSSMHLKKDLLYILLNEDTFWLLGVFSLVLWCKMFREKNNILPMKMREEACHRIITL